MAVSFGLLALKEKSYSRYNPGLCKTASWLSSIERSVVEKGKVLYDAAA
ncbi:MAG: hypothetical protein JW915_22670 [Chitinispirillaceae bacterium]|nr:hypothetical protein [Chitinispirillaceae bacterium]